RRATGIEQRPGDGAVGVPRRVRRAPLEVDVLLQPVSARRSLEDPDPDDARLVKLVGFLLALSCALAAAAAEASVGLIEIPEQDGEGVVTIYYRSTDEAKLVKRSPFTFDFAWRGVPARGNGRLIVISHGSGGSPWVHANLAQILVADGFVVAMPEHRGDNYQDHSTPGPESWKRRPLEVSRTIDV